MDDVADISEWDHYLFRLRQSLERAVTETGSLTDARVLRISSLLDQVVVAQLRDQAKEETKEEQ